MARVLSAFLPFRSAGTESKRSSGPGQRKPKVSWEHHLVLRVGVRIKPLPQSDCQNNPTSERSLLGIMIRHVGRDGRHSRMSLVDTRESILHQEKDYIFFILGLIYFHLDTCLFALVYFNLVKKLTFPWSVCPCLANRIKYLLSNCIGWETNDNSNSLW